MTKNRIALRGTQLRLGWFLTGSALLGGIALDRAVHHVPPTDAAAYHQRVARAAGALPYAIGSWQGEDVPVPPSAIALLHPNVIISRWYRDASSDLEAGVLLVQCHDARDLLGHFPPVCYVNQGWTLSSATPTDWHTDAELIHGTRYRFATARADCADGLIVDDFMILPDGRTYRDMQELDRAARDRGRRHFGAAQMQIVISAASVVSPEEQDRLVETFIQAARPFLDAMQTVSEDHHAS